ncbi:ElsH Metal-dependent hydrolase [Methylophilaceae bacterium]|jgi:endonuclease/exonuclease/phosphatase family metal-dependent hydrolase
MSEPILHNTLRIATFNIHKGYTHFNARFALHLQREMLRKLQADVIFLQEVQEMHAQHASRFLTLATSGQMEFLADAVWPDYAYGKNSVYPAGHHGNALLSKFPIIRSNNQDISAHSSEQRGMLHSEINIPNWDLSLHTICLHLGLFAKWRRQQLQAVSAYIQKHVPANSPLIIAGDFNDWGMRTSRNFAEQLALKEVFEHRTGKPARSFPSWLPMLRLDRIYVRGFNISHVDVHSGPQFVKISDHAILTATLTKI